MQYTFWLILVGIFASGVDAHFWRFCDFNGVRDGVIMPRRFCRMQGSAQKPFRYRYGLTCCGCNSTQGPEAGMEGDSCMDDFNLVGVCAVQQGCTTPSANQGSCGSDLVCCPPLCQSPDVGNGCSVSNVYGICSCECGSNSAELGDGGCADGLTCCKPIEPRFIALGLSTGLTVEGIRQKCTELGRGLPLPRTNADVTELISLGTPTASSETFVMTGLFATDMTTAIYPDATNFGLFSGVDLTPNIFVYIKSSGGTNLLENTAGHTTVFGNFFAPDIVCEKF